MILTGVAAIAAADVTDEETKPPSIIASGDWSELIQPPTTADQQQTVNFQAFAEALANESFSEAEVAAKQMIELANANSGSGPSERARALHNLAVAQQLQGSYDSAVLNYSAALDSIASDYDNLSPSLIMPLRGLALARVDLDLPREAQETFDRALHVSNVNHGPHSLNQLPILNAKIDVYLDQQDAESALDILDRIQMLYTREYPKHSEELLPLYYQQAAIYDKLKMYGKSYDAWRHVLTIKQRHHAKNDVALIEPHMRIAEINIRGLRKDAFRAVTTSPAEKHLKKALWIAENSPEENWEAKKDCLLSLADFYTLFGMKGRANRYYSAAWNLMSSDKIYWPARAKEFETPVPLARVPPHPYARFEYSRNRDEIDTDDFLEGEMLVAFTINEHGRTTNQRIIEADPADFQLMERRVLKSVEEFVYRPRYMDGKAAPSVDQQYRASYFYLPADHEASIEKTSRRGRR